MALKVEVSKPFQYGISSQKSNHFSVMFRSVKQFFSCYKKVFLEASCASLHFAAKAWKFVTHLCIYFVWRIKTRSIKLCLSIGERAFYSFLTIGLRAWDFYEVIVNEGEPESTIISWKLRASNVIVLVKSKIKHEIFNNSTKKLMIF